MLDKVREFQRLGDSLGLGENAYKLLARWGCNIKEIQEIGNQAPTMKIRRWHDGKILAEQPLMDMAGYIGHRGDYHDIFLKWVRERNIPIRMGSEVVAYADADPTPSVTLATTTKTTTGETETLLEIKADVIVACDGIKSLARNLVLGARDDPVSSGYACFRAYFEPSQEMREDPARNAFLLDGDSVNFWIGPDTHVVQNTLRGGREFNWILTHRDDGDVPESWFQPGDMNEVRRLVVDLDPRIRDAIRSTERCLDWKICYRKPLSTWVSPKSHRIVLLGDSCHAHLPTSAQGASQACESAGVLAVCLGLVPSRDQVRVATRVYEKLRFPRTRVSQTHGEDLRDRWHNLLKNEGRGNGPIDPEMVKIKVCYVRTLNFRGARKEKQHESTLYTNALKSFRQNRPLYAFDAEQDAFDKWDQVSQRVRAELQCGKVEPLCD